MIPRLPARHVAGLLVVLVAGVLAPVLAHAQVPMEFSPESAQLSREELTQLLEQYERAFESPAYSDRIKADLRMAAARVQSRLEQGDFQEGDRIFLSVAGQPELPDTVAVERGPLIDLPVFGEISLKGVLRSEIADHIALALGRMIREPEVEARSLLRLSVEGAVGNPGFFVLPAEALVSDAIMIAGGPASNAELEKLRIERAEETVYSGQMLQAAIAAGRTLDQLSLRAGDRFILPAESRSSIWPTIGRYAMIIGSVTLLGIRIW
jgi:hypothetical protein